MSVLIVDYGVGNLASVRRAIEECSSGVWISDRPTDIRDASHIVLPGVGSFADGMHNLELCGWIPRLRQAALQERIPLLGICLGMQLLADIGEEGKEAAGLGLISGMVRRLEPGHASERLPHVGWNEVNPLVNSPLFTDIPAGADFYFVHSFHFEPSDPANVLACTPYCGDFVSAVGNENVVGVQFHPEKSSRYGLQLLRNFLAFGVD